MKEFLLLSICVTVVWGASLKPLESDDIINYVNNAQTTWKAGRNFHPKFTSDYAKRLCGLKRKLGKSSLPLKEPVDVGNIPKTFDARKKWPNCMSLKQLRDQGDCGSCWAVASAAAFTDRLCIATNASWNGHLSAEEVLTCCKTCVDTVGCEGGYDDRAWLYFKTHGIVSGGDYGSKEGCQPYKKQPCEHHVNGTRAPCASLDPMTTPKCQTKCINKKIKYKRDHHKVSESYALTNVQQIQKDILENGPIEAGFDVYTDFLSYKSGVYQHTTGEYEGGHAVKVIGWGVQNKVPYWLVANSWNSDWGDKGFFKIKRGSNECQFESDMSGGIPIVN
uniref:Cathepsin B3 n=1 Tax=Mahanarva fimbriolata TaxID=672148 RepID=A0A7S6R1F9_9HEMI|nr:cathepsin B3 [Mahanarva fimbriolata]UJP31643.1 cathepsin B3 [Dermestes maculatus]